MSGSILKARGYPVIRLFAQSGQRALLAKQRLTNLKCSGLSSLKGAIGDDPACCL